MPRQLLYATNNPGKIFELRAMFSIYDIPMLSPVDIGLELDVPEPGATLEENARLKAQGFLDHLARNGNGARYVVMTDDTGVEIDALDGEPGIHVRRWDGSARMTDEAIINLTLHRLDGVPLDERGAQFRTVIAVGVPGEDILLFDGTLRGVILEAAAELRIKGFPFESLFFVPDWDRLLGAIHQLPEAERAHYPTHRQIAVRHALPHIRALLDRVD
jgi:non-canonical purine NTP pyrophosphatase (RdgB/HAM1 family)